MNRIPVSGDIETVTYFREPMPWMVLEYSTNPDDSLDQEQHEFASRAEADRHRAVTGGALYRRDSIHRVDYGLWECEEWMVTDYA